MAAAKFSKYKVSSKVLDSASESSKSRRHGGRSKGSHSRPESDARISSCARTLAKLDSEESFSDACLLIEDLLKQHDNRVYVQKSFHLLTPQFLDVFKALPDISWNKAAKKMFSKMLSAIVSGMEHHNVKVFDWIVETITYSKSSTESGRSFSISFVVQDISLLLIQYLKPEQATIFLKCISPYFEEVENTTLFKILCRVFVAAVTSFKNIKYSYVKYLLDVLLGWMVNQKEAESTREFCSDMILKVGVVFEKNSSFLLRLLPEVIEDMGIAVRDEKDDEKIILERVTLLLRAYNTIISLNRISDKAYLNSFSESISGHVCTLLEKTGTSGLDSTIDNRKLKLFNAFNYCLYYTGSCYGHNVRNVLQMELKLFLSDSVLESINCEVFKGIMKALKTWLDETLIRTQLSDSNDSLVSLCSDSLALIDMSNQPFARFDRLEAIECIQSMLAARNIDVLQNVYNWLLTKIDFESKKDQDEAILFVIICLGDLASSKGGAILTTWALSPNVFELLLKIEHVVISDVAYMSLMKLLRSHCESKSHFVSSLSPKKAYGDYESPAASFLPRILQYWIKILRNGEEWKAKWTLEWIKEFLKSSVVYAQLLSDLQLNFFDELVSIILERDCLNKPGIDILIWLVEEQNYKHVDPIIHLLENRCIERMKKTSGRKSQNPDLSSGLKSLLLKLPSLIVCERNLDCGIEHLNIGQNRGSLMQPLTLVLFNDYIHDLLSIPEICYGFNGFLPEKAAYRITDHEKYTLSAIEFLIQSKLKTSIGKAQDFFAQVQLTLRKYVLALKQHQMKFPCWKLRFLFLLEQQIMHCVYGSFILNREIPEHMHSFYQKNQYQCYEWLKRLRVEIFELCIASDEVESAYCYSALLEDMTKVGLSYLKLEDSLALKSLKELGCYFFLEGKFDKVLEPKDVTQELIEEILPDFSIFNEKIMKMMNVWTTTDVEDVQSSISLNCVPSKCSDDILSLQFDGLEKKVSIRIIAENQTPPALRTLLKVHEWTKSMPKLSPISKESLESEIMKSLIKSGNVELIKSYFNEEVVESMNTNGWRNPFLMANIAEMFYDSGDRWSSGKILGDLLELTGSMDVSASDSRLTKTVCLKASAIILEKLTDSRISNDFVDAVFENRSLKALVDESGRLKSLIILVLGMQMDMAPEKASTWLAYANCNYQAHAQLCKPGLECESDHINLVLEGYAKYFKLMEYQSSSKSNELAFNKTSNNAKYKAMMRFIKIIKESHGSHSHFDFENVIFSRDWLVMLPELSQIPELRSFLLTRFPEDSAMYLVSNDTKGPGCKHSLGRKLLFDPSIYCNFEANEDRILNSYSIYGVPILKKCKNCPVCSGVSVLDETSSEPAGMAVSSTAEVRYKVRSLLNIPEQVKSFVRELQRVGATPEENWINAFQRIMYDWTRRLAFMKREGGLNESAKGKMQAFLYPVIKVLESMSEESSKGETEVEMEFLAKYHSRITNYVRNFTTCTNSEELLGNFEKFTSFIEKMSAANSTGYKTSLNSLSPVLSRFHNQSDENLVFIPGLPSNVHILRLDQVVTVMATKTKPKKLRFIGSNGKKYEYLVKGHENMNVDAGVMQLMTMGNAYLNHTSRTYKVIPIGKRGGLIQIVGNAIPMFSLYKRHLKTTKSVYERTSDMYWRLMNEEGCVDRNNKEILRKVFHSLREETPCNLIDREIHLCAYDPKQWYIAKKTFTKDSALGCTFNYLLGLGDRHLDNILINFIQGYLVHVDFNVIFKRGESLKVAERVPFRLTQNFVEPLLFPKAQGPFSEYMDKFFELIQADEEMFTFLLHSISFLFELEEDPPVDASVILSSELACAVYLFQIRCFQIIKHMTESGNELLCAAEKCLGNPTIKDQLRNLALNVKNDCIILNDNEASLMRELRAKLNGWKRLLANLDPLIQYILINCGDNPNFKKFIHIVQTEWIPKVSHYWFHHDDDKDLLVVTGQLAEAINVAKTSLSTLGTLIYQSGDLTLSPEAKPQKNYLIEHVDLRKVADTVMRVKVPFFEVRKNKTIQSLIEEARDEENLSLMYEGWTSWV